MKESLYAYQIPGQKIATISAFNLESGIVLYNVPVAYKSYGSLSDEKDNVIVVCHALTGNADLESWWGHLIGGPGKALDTTKYFIICLNSLGSPYGTASPLTYKDGDPAKGRYGPDFPLTTVRDDVNIFKAVLDSLGVRQIFSVVGGSMGGMLVLEFAYFGQDYVRSIVPISTSASYSAWGISWGEIQRRCIYNDPKFNSGKYSLEDPPVNGLATARMAALLTYRSRNSFQARFGRKMQTRKSSEEENNSEMILSAHSYLSYQGDKFINRFDANCYVALTRKLDMHDVSRDRVPSQSAKSALKTALAKITQPTMILGIESDVLFPYTEQKELYHGIPNSTLKKIESDDGHDGFLLETEQVNRHILEFFLRITPEIGIRTSRSNDMINKNAIVRVGYKGLRNIPLRRRIKELFKQDTERFVKGR